MGEAAMLPITSVELHEVGESGPTRAIGSVTLGNAFVVHGVRVVEGQTGVFVAMPQRKDGDRYRDVAHPITAEMRAILASAVLEEYQRQRERNLPSRSRDIR